MQLYFLGALGGSFHKGLVVYRGLLGAAHACRGCTKTIYICTYVYIHIFHMRIYIYIHAYVCMCIYML